MTTRVNYVVANYIGPQRRYDYYQNLFNRDPLHFLNHHIRLIDTVEEPDVHATYIFNDDVPGIVKNKLGELQEQGFDIVYRKNSGFSYGIWNDTIEKNINDYDYFFLIEDDYVPTCSNFLKPFLDRCINNVAFVCGLVDYASYDKFPIQVLDKNEMFPFPSISNGLMSASACRKIYSKHNSIFNINYNSDYWSAYTNQIYFCKHFTDMGYRIVDTLDEFQSPYNNATSKNIVIYGQDKKPALITPIEVYHV